MQIYWVVYWYDIAYFVFKILLHKQLSKCSHSL